MTHPRNGQPLLDRGWGEQRPCSAEEDPLSLPCRQLSQQVPAQGNGTAAAAGAPGMDILLGVIKDHAAAVCDLPAQGKVFPPGHLQKQLFAVLSQVTGDDEVVVFR